MMRISIHSSLVIVCVPCRMVKRVQDFYFEPVCPSCMEPMKKMWRWSPPKKTNNRAWKRIERGDWMWDHRRVRRVRDGKTSWMTSYRTNGNQDLGG